MGAVFYLTFLIILLLAGLVVLALGIVFLILRDRRKKPFSILTGIFLPLGISLCVFPVGFFLFLRSSNAQLTCDYVNTGIMIESGYQEGAFTANGIDYEPLEVQVRNEALVKGAPVYSWDISSAADRFFGYYDRGNYYTVENGPGLDILCSSHTLQPHLWCRSDQLAEATVWYADTVNYQWCTVTESYELLTPQPDSKMMDAFLLAQDIEPVRYTTPLGAEITRYILVRISSDGIVMRDWVNLTVYEGRLCFFESQQNTETASIYTVHPLSEELSSYFLQLLSADRRQT